MDPNRLRSRTRHNFEVPGWVEFEESAPFSYMCHNFQIPECVGFEESAPFPYKCHNFDDELRCENVCVRVCSESKA